MRAKMRLASPSLTRTIVLSFAALIFTLNAFASSPFEQVIYTNSVAPGPEGALVADAAGNLYGTVGRGGSLEYGSVIELSPPTTPGGAWTETDIHTFGIVSNDDGGPTGTLIIDKSGNLYGTTGGGPGTIFKLSPPATPGGAWTEAILWRFDPNKDYTLGLSPTGKLCMDEAGNLYGTAGAGPFAHGIVFELVAPKTSGSPWRERVLYAFGANPNDGSTPGKNVLLRGGVLYGTTEFGGTGFVGTVFQLVRKPGLWTETILHTFTAGDGYYPFGALISDPAGNLYGTTRAGGSSNPYCSSGCGIIYELSPPTVAGDPWVETMLYSFTNRADGAQPYSGLWRDQSGDLYGTASDSAQYLGCGTVYKLKPPAVSGGAWTEVTLHNFGGFRVNDGCEPVGELILVNGVFYGTTELGGKPYNAGTAFSLVP
jgi:uncharacterized repeat protein (TIGR03803 family)